MKMNQLSFLLNLPSISDEDRLLGKDFRRPRPSLSIVQSYEDGNGSYARCLRGEY